MDIKKMYYINYKYNNEVETIEELKTLKEAKYLLKEYKMVSPCYYISKRSTRKNYIKSEVE